MVDLQMVVQIVLWLLIAAAVFGLLLWLVHLVGGLFPGETAQLFVKVARVVLAVLAVLLLIGLLLSFVSHTPLFRWGGS